MKIRAAILEEMGRPRPYALSRPLTIAEIDLAPPGRGKPCLVFDGACGPRDAGSGRYGCRLRGVAAGTLE